VNVFQLHPQDDPDARFALEIERLRAAGKDVPEHVIERRRALADVIEQAHRKWQEKGR
jgi:hypothetical protein